jgi:hypothetical protein
MIEREIDGVQPNSIDQEGKGSDDQKPHQQNEGITRDDLIEQLDNQVKHFDTLPEHQRFSFTTNCDLYYFMMIILNILKKEV